MVAVETQPTKKKKGKKAPKSNGTAPAPAAKADPKSGQSGPPLELSPAKINGKEKAVLAALSKLTESESMSLAELADKCFPGEDKKSNSWVRNSMRRLVRAGYVAKVDRGTYQMSADGRKRLG
jgi:hypothetical protein